MRRTIQSGTWVVYEMLVRGKPSGVNAVCEQREWDEMERIQPGAHPVIRTGIKNEGEAEQIARTVRPAPTVMEKILGTNVIEAPVLPQPFVKPE